MKRIFLQWWYGIKFERGYTYRRIRSHVFPLCNCNTEPHFRMFERIIDYWKGEGWEQYGDIKPGWSRLYLWIRKKSN